MTNHAELHAELKEYARQIEEIKRDAESLIAGLTEGQFNWRPAPNRWSIGDCLEHLNVTARLYWPMIAESINHSRVSGVMSQGPYKHGWLGNWFVRSAEPPVKTRFKAPRKFLPPSDQPVEQVWPQFLAFQNRMLNLIRDANGVDLGKAKVQMPVTKLIKLTLGQALGLVAAHERRHLWQARQVKESADFPQ
jgi:DinB superfamily